MSELAARASRTGQIPAEHFKQGSQDAIYRRCIRTLSDGPKRVVGDLVDDPHHFRVVLEHDGERVTSAEGEALRYPWTTCPGAALPLRALVGMTLDRSSTAIGAITDPKLNCTHMFDLAGLCVSHAAAGLERRQYDCAVTDAANSGARAELRRDGVAMLEWRIDGQTIEAPQRYAGVQLHQRFMDWCYDHLEAEEAEAAIVLRRACFVAPTRKLDLDTVSHLAVISPGRQGVCHSHQPERIHSASRVKGMQLDFSDAADTLIERSVEHAERMPR